MFTCGHSDDGDRAALTPRQQHPLPPSQQPQAMHKDCQPTGRPPPIFFLFRKPSDSRSQHHKLVPVGGWPSNLRRNHAQQTTRNADLLPSVETVCEQNEPKVTKNHNK